MKSLLGMCSLFLAFFIFKPAQDWQSRYRRVEAYEIRPDILATPTYTKKGLLCTVSVEKRHVQADVVDMDPTIPREVAMAIIDELAPPSERGPRSPNVGPFDYDVIEGSVVFRSLQFENVSIVIYRNRSGFGDAAVVLTWDKNCSAKSTGN